MPSSFRTLSNFTSMSMTEFPGRTYKNYPSNPSAPAPLWPFGSGLSYSSFSLHCNVSSDSAVPQRPVPVVCVVRNAGAVAGAEVVMLFHEPPNPGVGGDNPDSVPAVSMRQLLDFERVHLATGEQTNVRFVVTARRLQLATKVGGSLLLHGGHGETVSLVVVA